MTTTNREQAITIIRDALETGKTDGLEAALQSIRVRREDAFTPRYTATDMVHIVESVPYANLLWCAIPAKDRTTFRDAVKGGDEAFVTYAGTDHGKRMILVLGWVERQYAVTAGKGFTFHDLLPMIDHIERLVFDLLSDCAAVTEARGTPKDVMISAAQAAIIVMLMQNGHERVQVGREPEEDVVSRINNFMEMLSPLVTIEQLVSLSQLVMKPILRDLISNQASA
ncbi:hypothetical protein [Burkholderia vietnamiensis]|uniref:hypothetical protein n=1 Tax=Burkholderia vietnamiensis TaxID=60552 RepID=UPI001CF154F1|nr:hypothetical protein [Burkholderia vietnamiensis]MCA8448905.1 hypothetical protein [Burkholderia vietnamiensis]